MPRLARIAPILLLVLVPILASWPALVGFSSDPIYLMSGLLSGGQAGLLPGSPTADLDVGVTTQALGHLAAEQWLHGVVPWWNLYSGIGMPLAGEMQASALFLPFVLLLHFQSGTLLLKLSMQILAGLFCHALLRRLQLGRIAALLGALLFALNGSFAWLGHGPIMPIAFLPLLLLGIEHARAGGFRLIAAGVALSLYAGFPETAYLDGLLALAWAGWRIATDPRSLRLAARVTLGGVLGLLLATPALWSFAHMLLHGTTGNHEKPLSIFAKLPEAVPPALSASWLFPTLTGPLSAYGDPAGEILRTAPYQGGYLGTLPLLLALFGLFGPGLRPLRWVLAGWILLVVGGVTGVPGLDFVLYAVPMLRQVIVARYAVPSCCLAALILASLAFSDWSHDAIPGIARRAAPLLLAAIIAAALFDAWPLLSALTEARAWEAGSLAWAAAALALALTLILRPPGRRAALLLAGLLVFDAAAMFAVPLLAGPRDATIDTAAVHFLQDRIGLQRFYTLGPYRPNYGAFFATAQLNHEYLPLPANWVTHIETKLDPSASVIMFRGNEPPGPDHAAELIAHLDAFEALAVRLVVTPPGEDPFRPGFDSRPFAPNTVAHALMPGQTMSGTATAKPGQIESLGVDIATYLGRADGAFEVQLCTDTDCTTASVPLAGATDNARLTVPLAAPLAVSANQALRWRLRHDGGTQAVAIMLPTEDASPLIHFAQHPPTQPPPRIYRDPVMDIYELPNAAPYFDTEAGPCRLIVQDRQTLQATCDAPAILHRRELFFSGWRARIADTPAEIAPFDTVMQQISLPAGTSTIRFDYAPPYARLCWLIAVLAGIALIPFRRPRLFSLASRSA